MSTLQSSHNAEPSLQIGRQALSTLAVLVAIAIAVATVAVALRTINPSPTHRPPSVSAVNDTGPVYAPPHDWTAVKASQASQASPVGDTAANDQGSSAYTKGVLYKPAR
jgi:hypothetical protein